MKSIKNEFNYDMNYDVLSIHFASTKNSIGEEEIDNIIEFRDLKSHKVTGITILDFVRMFEKKDSRLVELVKKYNFEEIYKAIAENQKLSIK